MLVPRWRSSRRVGSRSYMLERLGAEPERRDEGELVIVLILLQLKTE